MRHVIRQSYVGRRSIRKWIPRGIADAFNIVEDEGYLGRMIDAEENVREDTRWQGIETIGIGWKSRGSPHFCCFPLVCNEHEVAYPM